MRHIFSLFGWFLAMAIIGFVVGLFAGCGGNDASDDPTLVAMDATVMPVDCVASGCAK